MFSGMFAISGKELITMKKVIAWLLVLALTAAISIGATLAYLTDTDEDVNVMTLGKVKIDQLEYERIDDETQNEDAKVQQFHNDKPLYPAIIDKDAFDWETGESNVDWEQIGKEDHTSGIWNPNEINNEQDKMVFVENTGDYDAFVRSVFAFEANGYTLDQFRELFHLNLNESDWTWEWVENPATLPDENGVSTNYIIATATYNKVLKPGELTEISLSQIALDPSADNADVQGFGDYYQILVKSQGIQADGFEAPVAALNEGFGVISEANLPFEIEQPLEGIDMYNALRFYQGDAGKPIHTKITNVVFGRKRSYPDVVNNYEATIVSKEQDVNVYTYYVPNGSKYDVYFLANGPIYAPADSNHLFSYMTSLLKVDTSNFDVSRVVNARRMFRNCEVLQEIDVSKWDTSNMTDMHAIFYRNYALKEADVSNWNVSNAKDLSYAFYYCKTLETLDVADWNLSSLVNIESFLSSGSDNKGDMKIRTFDMSKWNTPNLVDMDFMFYGCGQLTELDLSSLDVSKVKSMDHVFTDCYKLEKLDFTGWDTSNVKSFSAMFNNCDNLKSVDVSSFDTQSALYFDQMFEYCYNLEEIIGLENWNTANVVDFWEMFSCCYKLKELNLSSFNTSKLKTTYCTFSYCSSLKTIYVGDGWDVSNVTEGPGQVFIGCNSLVGGQGTSYAVAQNSTLSYAHVDGGAENPGYLTHINDKPVTE